MDREQQFLLSLLKAFINQSPLERQENLNWIKIKYLADIHSVTGIVGYMAKQYKLCTEEEGFPVFWNSCMRSIYLYTQRAEKMASLSRSMQEEEIDHILMKGYVVKDYYPVPELRSYGDVDLVIHLSDRQKSHALMLRKEYKVKNDWEAVYSYVKGNEFYEIHSDIMEIDVTDKADYKGYFSHMWEHVTPVSDHVYTFTPEYHFIYLLTHIAKHIYSSGAGLRMYLDLAAFILHYGEGIDWEWIKTELEKLKLYDFACVSLYAVEEWYGVACPMELHAIADSVLEDFLKFTFEGGVFGHENRESGVNVLKHSAGEDGSGSRIKILLGRLFPPASQIEARYTYLQGRHYLLPFAWIHRLVKTRDTLAQHSREANVILNSDMEEARRLKELNDAIGL